MKSFIRYLLVGILSTVCGAFVTHQIMWKQIRARVIPFDRSRYGNMCIELAFYEPQFNFDFQGTNQVFWTFSSQGRNPISGDLEKTLRHWAGYSTNFPFIVSFNPEVSVAQVEKIANLFREAGFPPFRCLIEDNRGAKNNRSRRFRELRIGAEGTFYWHTKEWLIDDLQKGTGRHPKKEDRETKQ